VADGGGPQSQPMNSAPRIVAAGAEEALERFNDAELLAAGKVNVISLEAVQSRMAARWELRRDQVYEFTTRVLERGVGAQGFFMRVSMTDFFIVHPDLGAVAGQTACLRYLREVLNHFLGEDSMAASGVLQVTKISGGGIEARQSNVTAADEAAAEAAADSERKAAQASADETSDSPVNQWTPFVANDGRQLRVSATLEPVFEMKSFNRIGFRMVRRVMIVHYNGEEEMPPQQVAMLSTSDLLRVDMATIVRGIDRLRAGSEQQPSLIVPLSFTSLSSQKGRAAFVTQLKEAGSLVRLGVICEICDIEGVPPSMLLAAASLLRPFTLLVVGRLSNTLPGAIGRLEGTGLQALSFECPNGLGDAEFVGWATQAVGAAKRVAKSVAIYRVGSSTRAGALASLGATHVSLAG
jgi:hypothetical protein